MTALTLQPPVPSESNSVSTIATYPIIITNTTVAVRPIRTCAFRASPPGIMERGRQQQQSSRQPAQVQPCRYKVGKTLGAGSYSVVKECVHIDTGRYYAAKVINKRLMAGREHMVRSPRGRGDEGIRTLLKSSTDLMDKITSANLAPDE